MVGEERPRWSSTRSAQNLSVTGYRTAASADNDPGGRCGRPTGWMRVRLWCVCAGIDLRCGVRDGHPRARRAGCGCVRGPKDILTATSDPLADEWPQFALEIQYAPRMGRSCGVRRTCTTRSSSTRSTSVRSQSTTRCTGRRPTRSPLRRRPGRAWCGSRRCAGGAGGAVRQRVDCRRADRR